MMSVFGGRDQAVYIPESGHFEEVMNRNRVAALADDASFGPLLRMTVCPRKPAVEPVQGRKAAAGR